MAAPFKCDEKVTIERLSGAVDPDYGTPIESWVTVASRYWANCQDVLPSRGESTANGLRTTATQTRMRMPGAGTFNGTMRATLHGHGDRVMQIISGPVLMDDRVHYEFMLESYGRE